MLGWVNYNYYAYGNMLVSSSFRSEIGKQQETVDKFGRKTQFNYDERGYSNAVLTQDYEYA